MLGLGGGLALAVVDRAIIQWMLPASPSENGASFAGPETRLQFHSRPDLAPHPITVLTAAGPLGDGYMLLSPAIDNGPTDGLVIVDNQGEPVWMNPVPGRSVHNLQVQRYRGEPVLTWWEGDFVAGHGNGEGVIADTTYREIARVRAAGSHQVDLHAFRITPHDTALFAAYSQVPDATAARGQPILEGVVQEIDIATDTLLFEWHSHGAVDLDESFLDFPSDTDKPYDYIHVNSIAEDLDGHLLVSARNTSTVYKLNRSTGDVLWRMGGKRSDFTITSEAEFSWQHDAQRQPDGTLTLFDDQSPPTPSRGLILKVDETARTVALVREFRRPTQVSSNTRGNVQVLPNGNVFVGWGGEPFASEFGPLGDLRFDLALWPGELSYRAFRFPWRGRPTEAPAVVATRPTTGGTVVFASWNGATDVAHWEVLGGTGPDQLRVVAKVPRVGFETVVNVSPALAFVTARALDANGTILGTSPTVQSGV